MQMFTVKEKNGGHIRELLQRQCDTSFLRAVARLAASLLLDHSNQIKLLVARQLKLD